MLGNAGSGRWAEKEDPCRPLNIDNQLKSRDFVIRKTKMPNEHHHHQKCQTKFTYQLSIEEKIFNKGIEKLSVTK